MSLYYSVSCLHHLVKSLKSAESYGGEEKRRHENQEFFNPEKILKANFIGEKETHVIKSIN